MKEEKERGERKGGIPFRFSYFFPFLLPNASLRPPPKGIIGKRQRGKEKKWMEWGENCPSPSKEGGEVKEESGGEKEMKGRGGAPPIPFPFYSFFFFFLLPNNTARSPCIEEREGGNKAERGKLKEWEGAGDSTPFLYSSFSSSSFPNNSIRFFFSFSSPLLLLLFFFFLTLPCLLKRKSKESRKRK